MYICWSSLAEATKSLSSSGIYCSDRSKSRKYEACRNTLDSVAVELSCMPVEKRQKLTWLSDELDARIAAMNDMNKTYKKFNFMAESEMKKDCEI